MYKLVWKGEVIESDIETKEEAVYLQREYIIAYGGTVKIVKQRKVKEEA